MADEFVPASGGPKLVIVMGVSGCGKSTTAENLAKALHAPYEDGDALHPESNVAKMSRGEPLTDADRAPWLKIIRERATELTRESPRQVVIACSALRKAYRELLRGKAVDLVTPAPVPAVPVVHPAGETDSKAKAEEGTDVKEVVANTTPSLKTYFVFIRGTREVLWDRMQKRQGHFMKASMLDSQLATLEDPEGEDGVVVVDLEASPDEQCRQAQEGLKAIGY
ncbi:carbohydrate kinase [Ceratobasidium sp. AG-I]|nr:carbohydrate kinase [Ceratobasidium sp. AG-I]